MFKENPNISSKGFINNHWWSWPIIISMFQFTQVLVRILIGKLSQKLLSRKIPIMIVMFILLIGLVLVTASNFADWAIVIAIITTGIMGATFGLDAQYWSENWNIKRGFLSSLIVFTIPFLAKYLAKFVNLTFTELHINLFWVTFLAVVFLTIVIIFYALKVKEDKSTIFIDNMNPRSKPFKNKSIYDVLVISFTASLIVGAFTFVNYLGITLSKLSETQKLIFPFIQIIFVILTPMFLLRFTKVWNLSIIASVLLLFSSLIITILFITNNLNKILLIFLISLINASFSIFIILIFGATLHFDHKFPALVLSIFLTIKSFFTGASDMSAQLITNNIINISTSNLGWIAFSVVIILNVSAFIIANQNYLRKGKKHIIKSLLEDSYKYEISW